MTPYRLDKHGALQHFESDTAGHVLTVIRDDGVNRHLRYGKPGTMNCQFDLITWPGHLCYTGDMGTYVFQRLEDMLVFFRGAQVNPQYWSEKLVAADCSGRFTGRSVTEFDPEEFVRRVRECRLAWMRDSHESEALDKDERRELWEAVDDDVLRVLFESPERAMIAANDFHWEPRRPGSRQARKPNYTLHDTFESEPFQYTHSFLWCCYALIWAIDLYDKQRAPAPESVSA